VSIILIRRAAGMSAKKNPRRSGGSLRGGGWSAILVLIAILLALLAILALLALPSLLVLVALLLLLVLLAVLIALLALLTVLIVVLCHVGFLARRLIATGRKHHGERVFPASAAISGRALPWRDSTKSQVLPKYPWPEETMFSGTFSQLDRLNSNSPASG